VRSWLPMHQRWSYGLLFILSALAMAGCCQSFNLVPHAASLNQDSSARCAGCSPQTRGAVL